MASLAEGLLFFFFTFLLVRAVGSNAGSVLASLSSWEEELITHEDYDEEGPEVVQKLNILALS